MSPRTKTRQPLSILSVLLTLSIGLLVLQLLPMVWRMFFSAGDMRRWAEALPPLIEMRRWSRTAWFVTNSMALVVVVQICFTAIHPQGSRRGHTPRSARGLRTPSSRSIWYSYVSLLILAMVSLGFYLFAFYPAVWRIFA